MSIDNEKSIVGSLLGTAMGDAIGLPCEGLSKQRQAKMFKDIEKYHFFFGRGMISDDTEHTCMVAQALIVSGGDAKKFTRSLAWRLRFWMMGLPAGIGFATLRAIIKLWVGFPGHKSGVFSAGNGPAMRSPIIGVCYGHDEKKMRELVRATTRLTHTDPKAEFGSISVALAAHMASGANGEDVAPDEYLSQLRNVLDRESAEEFLELIQKAVDSVKAGEPTEKFAADLGLGLGITGYIYHTVPCVIHAWLRNQRHFRAGIVEIVRCGGDSDTTAAILGGIMGAGVGKEGIPEQWLAGLIEWPRSAKWIEKLGKRLAESCSKREALKALRLSISGLMLRNIFFMIVVLLHGFRRILPPY